MGRLAYKMIKYIVAAQGLRLFSMTESTRAAYRKLGNAIFSKNRVNRGMPLSYKERSLEHLSLMKTHCDLADGKKVLEIGTGWVHWGAFFLRCFYELKVTMFDVWDNRQFDAFQKYVLDYKNNIDEISKLLGMNSQHAKSVISTIQTCNSYDDFYKKLGLEYYINKNGDLVELEKNQFDIVYSSDVMEHVDKNILEKYLDDLFQITSEGGYSFHQIVISDHLKIYDKSVNSKNYIRYSDFVWKYFFSNKVQYINRIQLSEWLTLFDLAGFELIHSDCIGKEDISNLPISKRFQHYDKKDLEVTVVILIHKKRPHPD